MILWELEREKRGKLRGDVLMKSKNRRQNKEVSGVRQRATVTKGISSLNWQKRIKV